MKKFLFWLVPQIHAILYRLSNGVIGGRMAGINVLLLTTIGRKSGQQRTTPLGYFEHDGGYVIIGSNGGQAVHPAWYWNIKSNPKVALRLGKQRMSARAEITSGATRQQLWSKLVAIAPAYSTYQTQTSREIPIVLLRPAVE